MVVTRTATARRRRGRVHTAELVQVSKGLAFVRNGTVEAVVGEEVVFKNSTDRAARLFFPEARLFTELRELGPVIEVPAGGRSRAFTVAPQPGAKKRIAYEYGFFSAATRSFAVGGSNPKIIILE